MPRRLGNFLLPASAQEPARGIATWTNPINKCSVLLVHYTADNERQSHAWRTTAREGYATESAWNQEQELDFSSWHGLPVYMGFSPELHIATESIKWLGRTDWPMIRGWDIGTHACVWAQLQRTLKGERLKLFTSRQSAGAFHVTERKYERFEIESAGLGIFIQECVALSNRWFPDIPEWVDIIDPAAFNRTITKTLPPSTIFQGLGLHPIPGRTQDIHTRVSAVEDWLSLLSGGEPALQIDPQALMLIDGMSGGYHWVSLDGKRRPDKGAFSHECNGVEYICTVFPSPKTVLNRHREERNEQLRSQERRERPGGYAHAGHWRDTLPQHESGKIDW